MKKLVKITGLTVIALITTVFLMGCGKTTIIREVASPTTVVEYQAPVTNKYDDYYAHVLKNSGQANTEPKADIIELGDLVCQSLDNNNSVRSVVTLLDDYAESTSDRELYAAIITGSIMYLCPEYSSDLQNYLEA